MNRLDKDSGRLSLRNSVLVWCAGIVIGWGFAVVLFYQLIRHSGDETPTTSQTSAVIATGGDPQTLADIAPAAGPAQSRKEQSRSTDLKDE